MSPENEDVRSVHTTDEYRYPLNSVFGWRSDESPTGWLSGIVVGHGPCLVKVIAVRPGIMEARR